MLVQWVAALLAWLLGVAVQLRQPAVGDPRWAVAVPVLCMALAGLCAWRVASCRHGWRGAALLCLCIASLGWGQAQWRAAQRLAQVWPAPWAQRTVVLTGRVDALPQLQAWGQRIEVEVLGVEDAAGHGGSPRQWRAGQPWRLPGLPASAVCPERVSLSWTSSAGRKERSPSDETVQPKLLPGQVWRWTVMLQAPDGVLNPGGFDGERWMFEHGLRAQGRVVTRQVPSPLMVRPATAWSPGLVDRIRLFLRDRIQAHVADGRVAGLIAGLTIGEQSAIGADDWDAMRDTGTAHLAAIYRHQKHNFLVF